MVGPDDSSDEDETSTKRTPKKIGKNNKDTQKTTLNEGVKEIRKIGKKVKSLFLFVCCMLMRERVDERISNVLIIQTI